MQDHNVFLMLLLGVLQFLILKSFIHLELIFVYGARVQLYFSAWRYPIFSTFVEETILPSLCILCTLVDYKYMWTYLWASYSVPLVFMFMFMPVPYRFDYCGFVIYFEIKKCDASSFVVLFPLKIILAVCGLLLVPYEF